MDVMEFMRQLWANMNENEEIDDLEEVILVDNDGNSNQQF